MSQFDVHANLDRRTRGDVPYLLDIQSDLLDVLATRVVVPLVSERAMSRPARALNPVFEVEGHRVVMSTAELAGVPVGVLGPVVGSLAARRGDIVGAVDLLLSGV